MRQLARLQTTTQERYALAVAGSDDGVWEYDFVNRRVFASARAREISGLPPGPEVQSIENGTRSSRSIPTTRRSGAPRMEAHLAGQTPAYEGECRMLPPRRPVPLAAHPRPVHPRRGRQAAPAWRARPATSTRASAPRKRCATSEEQYRAIFNAAADAFVLRDAGRARDRRQSGVPADQRLHARGSAGRRAAGSSPCPR